MIKQRFFVISDPQIGNESQERSMNIKRENVIKMASKDDVVIIPGDLTHNGTSDVNNPFIRYLCMCFCVREARGEKVKHLKNQLKELKELHVNPLKQACKDVLMCIGNHDSLIQWWTGFNPVHNYVKKEHGSLVYAKEINGIIVYSLSEWPTKKNVEWLSRQLDSHSKPFIVFFHYNLQGPYSDWWKNKEKDRLAKVLEPHKGRNVFIAEGHFHSSYVKRWNGFMEINGAGDQAICVDVTLKDSGEIESVQAIAI